MRLVLIALLFAVPCAAQTSTLASPVDEQTSAELLQRGHDLLEKARASSSGSQSVTLESYGGHSTMLAARAKSGGAELHRHFNDIFVVLEGEGTEVTGGTVANAREISPGEVRGTSVEGGERHVLHKGDVLHISPGVPHQMLIALGKTCVYYVVKIEQP